MSVPLLQQKPLKGAQAVVVREICASPSPPLTPPSEEQESADYLVREVPRIALDTPREASPLIAVIGVGYVGSHLVEAFAQRYRVLAFDVSEARVQQLSTQFKDLPVRCTSLASDLAAAQCFLISVPTILNSDKTIDTSYLRSAVATVKAQARPGSTVVVESSVAVGMTREFLGPLVESNGLRVGMSPERVDPGRKFPAFETIPKIISGVDEASVQAIREIYDRVFDNIVAVSSPEVAEMTKLYENCQRMVCAAFANEMADACSALGIDAWEVSEAAASKPFGYLPFRPGPGVGGHCIPVNPYYLLSTSAMPILQHATEVSWQRPGELADRFMRELEKQAPPRGDAKRRRVLVAGMGFKRGQSVMSNSPGVAMVVRLLSEWDVYVEFADPLVPQSSLSYLPKMNTDEDWNKEHLETFDGVIVAVDQEGLDMGILETLEGVKVWNYCPSPRGSSR